ncbi:MAG TPA: divalent-cation tolerance protein CutA [Solirubrobacteraceae bacterium]|jgi:periplasmic divalent cation tolerance protein|nr:divalent-cation tolerance protein CutA [Solirubrobacteraceae bacterium]
MNATFEPFPDAVVCLVTAPQPNAHAIGATIVERELAACVNIVPRVQSIYRWEGKVQEDGEALLVIKTTRTAVASLEALLSTIHPFDTFELVALDVVAGAHAYLQWVGRSVAPGSRS